MSHAESPKHDDFVPYTGITGWHVIEDGEPDGWLKWQYSDSPYRVVAHKNDRGHYEARFTSWYDGPSYLIAGNCGGDVYGFLRAKLAAERFMADHAYGCPPPGQMAADEGQ